MSNCLRVNVKCDVQPTFLNYYYKNEKPVKIIRVPMSGLKG